MSERLLEVSGLRVSFSRRRLFKSSPPIRAVDGVDFSIDAGQTLALVGESGSGKTTTARALLNLIKSDAGSVRLNGAEVRLLGRRAFRPYRRELGMVFQDPYASLDPKVSVGASISEPMRLHTSWRRDEIDRRVGEVLEQVGLSPSDARRYPKEFSGGQRQRICIARAIVLRPRLIVLDEPVSSLDVTVQNQVVQLLERLKREEEIAYLFVTHDLTITRRLADRVAVMYLGRIVEEGPAVEVLDHPSHPYTQALVSAVPVADPAVQKQRERIVLHSEPADPSRRPSGCSFHPRCLHAVDECRVIDPPVHVDPATAVSAACLLVADPALADRPAVALATGGPTTTDPTTNERTTTP